MPRQVPLSILRQMSKATSRLDMLKDDNLPGFNQKLTGLALVGYAKTYDNLIISPEIGVATLDVRERTELQIVDMIRAKINKELRLEHY